MARGRVENLKHFPKGVSGNPGGLPRKTVSLQLALEEALSEIDPKKRKKNALVIVEAAIAKAKSGSFKHLDLIFNRVHGKVAEKVEMDVSFPVDYAQAVKKAKTLKASPRFSLQKPTDDGDPQPS